VTGRVSPHNRCYASRSDENFSHLTSLRTSIGMNFLQPDWRHLRSSVNGLRSQEKHAVKQKDAKGSRPLN
jgi:predicted SprT family Zn-dependent metalloprotease